MEQQPPLLWTLADYERFLDHPDAEIRFWAKQHITTEYPEQASRLLVRLVNDPDSLLQFSGIEALDSLTDPESEAQLFALLPQVDENKQGWIITYLARRQSARFLPMLLEQVGSLDLQPKPGYDFLRFTACRGSVNTLTRKQRRCSGR
ncbi:MAG: HEAT repeat domain-containing protein [Caldilineaceae bacterium]